MISPPNKIPVCNGGQVELVCTTTSGLLEWSFTLFPENSTILRRYTRVLSTASQASYLLVNSTLFTFSRRSPEHNTPLVSRLLISPVSDGLNGTDINCGDADTSTSAIIQIINELETPGRLIQ